MLGAAPAVAIRTWCRKYVKLLDSTIGCRPRSANLVSADESLFLHISNRNFKFKVNLA